jgi:hypothetical protein
MLCVHKCTLLSGAPAHSPCQTAQGLIFFFITTGPGKNYQLLLLKTETAGSAQLVRTQKVTVEDRKQRAVVRVFILSPHTN